MRIGVYQFASGQDVGKNLSAIETGIKKAAAVGVRLLAFHECALCGYPPLETRMDRIDRQEIQWAVERVAQLAKETDMYIALGTVRFEAEKTYNSLVLIDREGNITGHYDKQALWGWDTENFSQGKDPGVFDIEGISVGFRICFDVRFPECFRQLYERQVSLCFVSFSDTCERENDNRYQIIKAHLITRAVENIMTVVSVNTISGCQTAPTAVFDHNGTTVKEAARNQEELLIYDYEVPEMTFGTRGRAVNNEYFMHRKAH